MTGRLSTRRGVLGWGAAAGAWAAACGVVEQREAAPAPTGQRRPVETWFVATPDDDPWGTTVTRVLSEFNAARQDYEVVISRVPDIGTKVPAVVAAGTLCGALLAHAEPDYVWIGKLTVAAGHRRRGAGSALLALVERNAAAGGYGRLMLGAAPEAEAFYARHGYRPEHHRPPTGPPQRVFAKSRSRSTWVHDWATRLRPEGLGRGRP